MTKIFLDENLSHYVAKSLALLCQGYYQDIEVHSTITSFGRGLPDEEIIPRIGAIKGILITRDFNIKRTRLQYELCKEHGLGLIFLTLPKSENRHWNIVKLLVNHWEEIVRVSTRQKLPFAFRIKSKGKWEKLV